MTGDKPKNHKSEPPGSVSRAFKCPLTTSEYHPSFSRIPHLLHRIRAIGKFTTMAAFKKASQDNTVVSAFFTIYGPGNLPLAVRLDLPETITQTSLKLRGGLSARAGRPRRAR